MRIVFPRQPENRLPVGMIYTFPNGNVMTLALTREPGRATWIKRRDYAFNNTTLYWYRTDYDAEGRSTETEDSLTATRQWLYNRRSELDEKVNLRCSNDPSFMTDRLNAGSNECRRRIYGLWGCTFAKLNADDRGNCVLAYVDERGQMKLEFR